MSLTMYLNTIALVELTTTVKLILFGLCILSSWIFGKYIISTKFASFTSFGDSLLLITRTRILSVCGFTLVTFLDYIHTILNVNYKPFWLINILIALSFLFIFWISFKKSIDKKLLSKLITTAYFIVLFVYLYRCYEFSFEITVTTQLVCVLLFAIYIFQQTKSIFYLYLLIAAFYILFVMLSHADKNNIYFSIFIVAQTFICLYFYFVIETKKNSRIVFSNKILNHSELFVLVADLKGEFVFVNNHLAQTIGLEVTDLLKNGWWKQRKISNDDIENNKKEINHNIKNEIASQRTNTLFIESKQKLIYINWDYTPFDGKYMLGIGKDVTKSKLKEDEKEIKQKNLEIYNSVLTQLSLKKIDENNRLHNFYEEVCCKTSDALNIDRVSIWFQNENALICEASYSKINANKKNKSLQKSDYPIYFNEINKGIVLSISNVNEDDNLIEFRENYFKTSHVKSLLDIPIRSAGALIGIICCEQIDVQKNWAKQDEAFVKSIADLISLNIEADKRIAAELAIKNSETNFRLLNETINDVFWLYDIENKKVLYKSPSSVKVLGYHPDEFYNNFTFWKTYIEETDLPTIFSAHEKLYIEGSFEIEYRIKMPNGTVKWILEKGFGIKNDEGKYTKCSGICTDITERKAKELVIETQTFDILSSINYAKRIQYALLPSKHEIKNIPVDISIYYKPKDIIGGDFYWVNHINNTTIIAVGDCTGHGVPGALMTSLGINGLINIVTEQKNTNPAQILNFIDDYIFGLLSKTNSDEKINDGMDLAILSINHTTNETMFSGAGRPLFYSQDNTIHKIDGARKTIGSKVYSQLFENTLLPNLNKSNFYLFSDGLIDQFGGEKQKRLGSKNFNDFLKSICHLPLEVQKNALSEFYDNWKGNKAQTDDMVWLAISKK